MQEDHPCGAARAEAVINLLEAGAGVRRRYQFFVWMQTHLQTLLPHQVAVCGAYQRKRRELGFEVFNSVVLTAQVLRLLSDARSPVLACAEAHWVKDRAQPVALTLAALARDCGQEAVLPLAAAGIFELLVHGVARPQRPVELETLFLLTTPGRPVTAQHCSTIALLMPYLHSCFLRVQSVEKEISDAAAALAQRGPVQRVGAAALSEREWQVLAHVREGLNNQQIGSAMGISPLTVKNHVQKLLHKLGASNRAQAVARTSTAAAEHDPSGLQPDRP